MINGKSVKKAVSVVQFATKVFSAHIPLKLRKTTFCWAVPEVDAGFGLNNKRYCHITNIAPNDLQEVIIGDIYRDEGDKSSIIKFADEYGIDWKPRVCYKVDLERTTILQFILELVGEGFDAIKEEITLKITRDELKLIFRSSETSILGFKNIS